MAEITDDTIAEEATKVQSMTVDGVTVTKRPLKDLIEAQEKLDNNARATSPRRGLQLTRLIPGSARGQ